VLEQKVSVPSAGKSLIDLLQEKSPENLSQ